MKADNVGIGIAFLSRDFRERRDNVQKSRTRLKLNSLLLFMLVVALPSGAYTRPDKSRTIQAITGVYRGSIGGRDIVLEIGADNPKDESLEIDDRETLPIVGRFFYRDKGVAYPMHGRFQEDGSLDLLAYGGGLPIGAELRLTFHGRKGQGIFYNFYGARAYSDETIPVSLMRVSRGFDLPWVVPEFGVRHLDHSFYDLLLDYPLKRTREIRVDREISYVLLSDPRFKVSLPRLTRFPDATVMAKVNRKLDRALQEDRIKAADCLFRAYLPDESCYWREEEGHTTLLNRDLLSVAREVSEWAGHPPVRTIPLMYNLRTGGFFYWHDLLRIKAEGRYRDGDSEGPVVGASYEVLSQLYLAHASPAAPGCEDYRDLELTGYFDNQGLVLMGEATGSRETCSRDVVIPYRELRPFVRKSSPFRSLLKAAGPASSFPAPEHPHLSAKKFNDAGLALYQRDVYDFAIAQYSEAIRLSPGYAQAFKNRGDVYLAKGDYGHAIENYSQALHLNPDYFEALLDRGLSYDNQGRYDQAVHDYSEAIRLDPNYAEAFFQRGSDYHLLGDKDSAVRDIERALRLVGDDADWFLNAGNHYYLKHDFNHALRAFDQVIRLHPTDAAALQDRGTVFYDQGDYDRAIADYSNAGAFLERGLVYQKIGDYDRAIQDFTESLRPFPDFVRGHEQRCEAYLLKGDYQHAIKDCTEALRLQLQICRNCQSSNNYVNRGLARLYAGDAESAYEDFSHSPPLWADVWLYLAHAPTGKDAQNQLKEHFLGSAPDTWPGPMFRLFFGDSTPEEVISTAGNNEKQRCEADLYLGEYYSLQGNRAQAQSLFQGVTERCAETLLESRIARAELKRMELH